MPSARTLRAISAAGMFAMLAMVSTPTRADVYECLVVGVADGDTLTARCGSPGLYEQVRVRLSGIDAPEKGQPFGTRARMALGALVFGRIARLECPKSDRYGRKVCSVWVAASLGTDRPAYARCGPGNGESGHGLVVPGLRT